MANVRLESLRVEAALDTSKYVQGAKDKVSADEKMVGSSKSLDQAIEVTERRLGQSASSLERLARSVDPAYAGQQKLERAQSTLSRALEQGVISQDRYNQLLLLAQQRY